ncbi:hypothetical protein [Oerskovia flava]|uniref:hypothetical protein n=1 Tax=Oerskovia flava TaxID=2986422 RepID=UPI00223F8A3C|nr:hypothetical protein [Oerskovia sp. JB1-3-2]
MPSPVSSRAPVPTVATTEPRAPQADPRGGLDVLAVSAAFAVLGAGLVNLAVAAGDLTSAAGAWGAALGLAEVLWAIVALRRTGPAILRVTLGSLLAVSAPAAFSTPPASGPAGTAVIAVVALQVLGAVLVARWLRRETEPAPDHAAPATTDRTGRRVLALFAAAVLVATLTTAGLADTQAGEHAVPHDQHRLPGLGTHHG